jgi:cyclopropane-fatty-acyl-phospholipid synthase
MLGDYREEHRAFDTVASIGMVSHVGPRGLAPYVRRVRQFIKPGGRYLHHDLMIAPGGLPQNLQVGPAFNKRYVWPGFHWFTLASHVRELEGAGFRVLRVDDLSAHYAKTTAAWYERMVLCREQVAQGLGEAGFRAWQIFLAGISGSLDNRGVGDYRILCEATERTPF